MIRIQRFKINLPTKYWFDNKNIVWDGIKALNEKRCIFKRNQNWFLQEKYSGYPNSNDFINVKDRDFYTIMTKFKKMSNNEQQIQMLQREISSLQFDINQACDKIYSS